MLTGQSQHQLVEERQDLGVVGRRREAEVVLPGRDGTAAEQDLGLEQPRGRAPERPDGPAQGLLGEEGAVDGVEREDCGGRGPPLAVADDHVPEPRPSAHRPLHGPQEAWVHHRVRLVLVERPPLVRIALVDRAEDGVRVTLDRVARAGMPLVGRDRLCVHRATPRYDSPGPSPTGGQGSPGAPDTSSTKSPGGQDALGWFPRVALGGRWSVSNGSGKTERTSAGHSNRIEHHRFPL